jgi:hypothetical protein
MINFDTMDNFNVTKGSANHKIYQRAYDIKFNLEWLLTRIIQLKESWKDNFCREYNRTYNNLPVVFDYLIDRGMEGVELCINILSDKNVTKTNKIKSEEQDINVWDVLDDAEKLVNYIRKNFDFIISTFNERLEGKQATLITSPWLKIAERAGLFDEVLISIDNLMKCYVGMIKDEEKIISGLNPWYQDVRTWNGLASTWLGNDYQVSPTTQILKCPVYLKLAANDLLPPLSHEAAHVIFGNIKPLVLKKQNNKNETLKVESNIQNIHALYLSFYSELIDGNRIVDVGEEYEITEDTVLEILKIFNDSYYATTQFPGNLISEFYTDLVGALIGGPGLFISLGNQFYRPEFLCRTHPSIYYRVLLGKYYCKHIGLENSYWDQTITKMLRKMKEIDEKNETIFLENFQEEADEEKWRRYHAVKEIHASISKAFRDDFYVKKLMEVFTNCYSISPLFIGKDDDPKQIEDTCKNIAERIWLNSEVVVDARAKDIVAASVLMPIRRPAYPTGRLYQSLIFSSQEHIDEKIKKDLQEDIKNHMLPLMEKYHEGETKKAYSIIIANELISDHPELAEKYNNQLDEISIAIEHTMENRREGLIRNNLIKMEYDDKGNKLYWIEIKGD